MTTITMTEIKLHAFIRTLFSYIEFVFLFITQPITMIRILRGHEWFPMKGYKGYYIRKYSNGVIGFRHKKLPGEFQVKMTHDNYDVYILQMLNYFEG